MGRKIPGKKHRGVKNPEKQNKQRLERLKGKINAPPSNPDFQEVPRSNKLIEKLKQRALNKGVKTKKVAKHPFKQGKRESDKNFLYRVKMSCNAVIQENAFENKYGVDIKRNPKTGQVEGLVKKKKDLVEMFLKEAKKNIKPKKGNKTKIDVEPSLTKSQKRKHKLMEKKLKKKVNENFEIEKDVIMFGEVVHSPPTLSVPRKVVKVDQAPRPGQKNLLLKSIIQNNPTQQSTNRMDKVEKVVNQTIDKTGKRKNLPAALRRKLEKQQTEIIEAYRKLKKKNNESTVR